MTILATLVYLIDINNKKTLMIHRVNKENDFHESKYNGLGGKLEKNESPIECAKREVLEESALEVSELIFKGHLLFPKFDKQKNDWLVFVYTSHKYSGKLIPINPEGNLSWIDNDKLLKLNLWEGDLVF
jgi:8-oxo-dGTP diphosphatase